MAKHDVGTERRGNLGCSIIGWLAFVMFFALIVLVGYKTYVYYGVLRRGEIVDLPQYREQFTTSRRPVLEQPTVDRKTVETDAAPALGADKAAAKLTIVEFGDFECPYTKQESSVVRTFLAKYGDRVRLLYRNYPLEDVHLNAKQAAIAGACAQEQGKFWAYHDRLFQHSPALGFQDLVRYSEEAGLDAKQFEKCLVDQRYKVAVENDAAQAVAAGVSGTPVFFFNGRKVEGAIPADVFERVIRRFLHEQ